ncbi:MAG: thermonuclease family protein [Alphaproteobacteria bacterium]
MAVRCWGAVAWCVVLLWASGVSAQQLQGVAQVVDGDTLRVAGERVRLFGIDAPERGQPCRDGGDCGAQSKAHLEALIGDREVICAPEDVDRYGRIVATCRVGGVDLNRAMVRDGQAMPYTDFSQRYARDAPSESRFNAPWDYRRSTAPPRGAVGTRSVENLSAAPDDGCAIKGNISSEGTRIYHRPGERSYAATRIDEGHGERWFCSVDEAEAAGWRAARR